MEEIVVNPHTGRWWTVGTHGAEFVDIPKNAIVFNHKQSEALLKNGNIFSRGKALAGGTALPSGTKSKLTSGGNNNSSSSKSSSSSTSSNNSSKSSSSDDKTKIDWIEVAINRVKRSLENFSNVMDDASRLYKRRLNNLERVKDTTNKQIAVQTSAYNRYMQEANSVNLSSGLKAKVRNGDISIGSYSDDTQKAIKEYQELYEKALDSADAIRELKRSLSDIYETKFSLTEGKYDNKLSNLQYRADMRQSKMDLRDSQGKVARVKDYEYLIKNAGKQQELLAEKSKKLTEVLNEAVSSGAIKKGGEQYYAYLNKIRDVNKELADSKVSVQEFKNSIKDAYVTRFEQKATKYDRKLNSNEYKSNAAQSRIDLAEANGWRANVADYVSLIKIETANQKILAEKSKKLQYELDRALKSGYLDKTMDEYWDMIDQIESVNQKLADSEVAVANFNSNIKNLKIENFNDVVEGFNSKLDDNTHKQNIQQGEMDLREAQGKEARVSDIQKLIDLEWKRQYILQDEVKRLKAELKDSGFKPGTKEYKELESAINSAEEAAQESNIRIETLNSNIKELNMQKFNDTAEKYDRWIYPREEARDKADRANQMLEAQGRFASEYNYRTQLWYESERKRLLTEKYQTLNQSLSEYEMYSDEWFEIYTTIQDVLSAIDDCTISTIEYKNAIRELNDELFDYKMDRVSQITSENDFLLSLLENEKQFDDEGNPTKYYDAAMGVHAVNYNVYMDKATEYAKEIKNLNSEIASDPSNKKLIERREELLGLQQDSIKAAQDEKNAMVSLVKEGIEAQLNSISELIDKYKESLRSAKDLYDYQKRIKEQTKNIASLEKQLSAYENDTSEEAKAKVQQLKVELEAAKSDLEETEYDRYISDQEELLDDLYDNYEKLLNEKVDDVNSVVKEQIANVNMNQDDIANTLREISQRENYNYTDTLEAIYNGVNAIASDKSNGGSETSSTDRTIYEILSEYDRQKQESEDWSKNEGTPSTQLEKEERAKEDEKNREKNDLLNSISSLKNELINALKSGKMKDWSEAEKYNSKANELLKLRDEAVDKGYLSRTSDEYKEISQLQSDVHKEYANAFWNSGTPTTPDDPVDPNWSEQPEPEPPKQSSSTTDSLPEDHFVSNKLSELLNKTVSALNTPEAKEQLNKLQQDKKQFDDLQKKLSSALKSGDLKKNPKKYKKDLNLLKTALDTVINSGIYKKSDAEYKNALSTYNAANKIINPPKTPKKIKVGGKINAGKAKIYATPGAKATTQYFGDDPIYIVLSEKNGYIQVRYHKAKSGSSGWFKKSDVKAYKYGGLVDETGFAWLDGTPGKPETVLDAEDSKNLMSLRDALQEMARKQGGISLAADYSKYRGLVNSTMINALNGEKILSNLRNSPANVENSVNNTFGDTVINIDHVEDYNDFMTKIRDDKKFEKMITAMTVGKLTGGSSLAKNKYSWK